MFCRAGQFGFFLLFLLSHPAWASEEEPSFSQILSAAWEREKLIYSDLNELERKAAVAPWLPTLSFGYDRVLKSDRGISINDNISVSSDNITVGPEDTDLDESSFTGNVFKVRAVWSLNELVFNRDRLAVTQQKGSRHETRLKLADYLSKIVAKRREKLTEYRALRGKDRLKAEAAREEALVLTEILDAWTGEKFHKQWWRGK